MTIKGVEEVDSPREKLIDHGIEVLQSHELLALILRNGTKDQNVLNLSRSILMYWSLNELFESDINDLINISGIGIAKATQIRAIGRIFELLNENDVDSVVNVRKVKNTKKVIDIIKNQYKKYYCDIINNEMETESLIVIYIDKNMNLINTSFLTSHLKKKIFLSNSFLLKECILNKAHYTIIVHNHLKDKLSFSKSDKNSYEKINNLLEKIEIKLIDYVIFNRNGYLSIRNDEKK